MWVHDSNSAKPLWSCNEKRVVQHQSGRKLYFSCLALLVRHAMLHKQAMYPNRGVRNDIQVTPFSLLFVLSTKKSTRLHALPTRWKAAAR